MGNVCRRPCWTLSMSSISGGHVLGGLKLDKLVTPERLEKHRVPERLAAEQPATSALAPLLDEAPKEGSWRRLGAILEESCRETDEIRKKAPGGPPPPPPPPPPTWHDAGPSSSSAFPLPPQASHAFFPTPAPSLTRFGQPQPRFAQFPSSGAPQPQFTPYGYPLAPPAPFGGSQPYSSSFVPPPFLQNQHGANQVPLGTGRSGQGGGWLQAGGHGGQGARQGAFGGYAPPMLASGSAGSLSLQDFDSAYLDQILNNEIDHDQASSFIKSASTTDAEAVAAVVAPKALALATHGPGFFRILDLFEKESKQVDETLGTALSGHCVELLKDDRGSRCIRALVKSKNLSSQLARSIRQELFNAIDALATSYEFVRLLCLAIHRTSRHELFAVFQRFSAFLKNQKMADVLRNEELTEMLNAGFHRLLELDTEENAAESQQTDTVRAVASLILAEGEICKESGPALHLLKTVVQSANPDQLKPVKHFLKGRVRAYACKADKRKWLLEEVIQRCSREDLEKMVAEVLGETRFGNEKLRLMLEDDNGAWVIRGFLIAGSHHGGPNYEELLQRTRHLVSRVEINSLVEKRLKPWL
ncbi:Proteophosphoglycan ppg4 [Rhodotorula toruloides]|nr:Proteophosphoglycan ppg4 [Rhodotorula toruloides]